jgi:hypothetical protein
MKLIVLLTVFLFGCSESNDSLESYWSIKTDGYLCRQYITFNLGIYTRGTWCVLGDLHTVGSEIEIGTYKVVDDTISLTPKMGSCSGVYDHHYDRSTYDLSYKLIDGGLQLSVGDWYSKGGIPNHPVQYGCYTDSGLFAPNPINVYDKL